MDFLTELHYLDWLLMLSIASAFILIPLSFFLSGTALVLAGICFFIVMEFGFGQEPPAENMTEFVMAQVSMMVLSAFVMAITVAVWVAHWKFKKQYSKTD